MDYGAILTAIGPQLVQLLSTVATNMHSPTAPTTAPTVQSSVGTMVHDAVIGELQAFLNGIPGLLSTKLTVDGWLGDRTKAAIEKGIAMLKGAGIG
jgi:hypothetical protein